LLVVEYRNPYTMLPTTHIIKYKELAKRDRAYMELSNFKAYAGQVMHEKMRDLDLQDGTVVI
jgi:hypothetical protein